MRKLTRSTKADGEGAHHVRQRLLYVEDNDDNWEVAQLRLGESYDLLRAGDSRAACEIIRRQRDRIDSILMDIELRGSELNGLELTKLLRGDLLERALPEYARNLPAFGKPILFVTAHGAKHSDESLLAIGGTRVISKPVDFNELRAALRELSRSNTSIPPHS